MPFRDVIGHRRLLELLRNSVAGGTLPPSLLLTGPSGIGKRFVAIAVAQALNCLQQAPAFAGHAGFGGQAQAAGTEHPPSQAAPATAGKPASAATSASAGQAQAPGTKHPPSQAAPATAGKPASAGHAQPAGTDACGVCAACTRIARGVHPDVLVVEPGENGSIKIEQVRDIVDRVAYRPFEGRRRVVIVDEADALVPQAQNALLKTLEEPPASSVFMLVTARPDVLLPTVRSRCPQLRFRPLSASDIAAALTARGHGEREARAIAATADGSLGRALEASAGDLLEAREVAERVLTQASSAGEPGRRLEGAKALLAKAGGGTASDREQLAIHLRAMAALLRDTAMLAARADDRSLANPDMKPALERLAPAYQGGRGDRAFAAVDRALVALKRNVGVKLIADWVVLQL